MKRADAGYLKKLSKAHRKEITGWASIPLVVMNNSEVSVTAHKLAEDVMNSIMQKETQDGMHELLRLGVDIPLSEFMFIDEIIAVNDPESRGSMEYNYFKVSGIDEGNLRIDYPTMGDGISTLYMPMNDPETLIKFTQGERDFTDDTGTYAVKAKRFLVAMMVTVLAFFKILSESDLYPVETRGTQHRKVHAKKPWQRSDLVTVIYLNKLPTEHKEPKGGHHASPCYHPRKGFNRVLKHEKFKNHPDYMKKKKIKPTWVGVKESIVNGTTYRVL